MTLARGLIYVGVAGLLVTSGLFAGDLLRSTGRSPSTNAARPAEVSNPRPGAEAEQAQTVHAVTVDDATALQKRADRPTSAAKSRTPGSKQVDSPKPPSLDAIVAEVASEPRDEAWARPIEDAFRQDLKNSGLALTVDRFDCGRTRCALQVSASNPSDLLSTQNFLHFDGSGHFEDRRVAADRFQRTTLLIKNGYGADGKSAPEAEAEAEVAQSR